MSLPFVHGTDHSGVGGCDVLASVGEVIVLSEVYLGAGSSGFLSFFI
jgi:hypothetical protein